MRVGRGPEGADGAWLTYYDKFDNGVLGTFLGCVDLDEVQRTSQHSELGPGIFEVDTASNYVALRTAASNPYAGGGAFRATPSENSRDL